MAIGNEESKGVHYLAKCVLRGSAVLHAVYCHLRSPSSLDIVFGKETSIELAVLGDDGIVQSICEQPVFGTIKDLVVLRWNEKFRAPIPQLQGKDLLVVLSDSGKLSFLTFCTEMHRFFAVTHIQLSEPGNSTRQLGRMLAVDSKGCFIAVSAYEDQLALFSLSASAGSNIVDKKIFCPPISEGDTSTARESWKCGLLHGTIWCMCFITKYSDQFYDGYDPILAVSISRGDDYSELLLLGCDIKDHSVTKISEYIEPTAVILSIVEVPSLPGFAFLFREAGILLMDLRYPYNAHPVYKVTFRTPSEVSRQNAAEESLIALDPDDQGVARALLELSDLLESRYSGVNTVSDVDMVKGDDPMRCDYESVQITTDSYTICSWSWEPDNTTSSKIVFCLDTGELYTMDILSDSDSIQVNLSECLCKVLPCKALLWVQGGFIAALVEMGDGLVLKFESGRLLYHSSIQNIAPILDVAIVDHHNERQDQMFACCGMGTEGSLRIIRIGISIEKLLSTAPTYHGVTGTWTMRMKLHDIYHSFLVLAFVEETRVLSVGLSFNDVTDSVGFQSDVCTLACGLVADGLLVQIHRNAVILCLPTTAAHPAGIPLSAPTSTSWFPDKMTISLGAVGHNLVIVATSNPCFLFILGVRSLSAYHCEIYEIQHMRLQNEVSCISIPLDGYGQEPFSSVTDSVDDSPQTALPSGVEFGKIFVIGTHKPSVEILSFVPEEGCKILAIGTIALTNTLGTVISGCIPQDVRLVLVDRFYVLAGLRNGMLLRFEWPATFSALRSYLSNDSPFINSCLHKTDTPVPCSIPPFSLGPIYCDVKVVEKTDSSSPVHLQLIAVRRIGITPVFLVPLYDSLGADIIALSDRPWLVQTARHSLAYTSIPFQPATHVTPVCSVDCPKGILFAAENALHLVEMVHSKRLNVQKFSLGSTPRKVLYHNESRALLVMRTEFSGESTSSDICRIDPLSGSLSHMHKFSAGEIPKCMQLMKVANEQVLLVGTSQSTGPVILPSGEAESTKGCLFVFIVEPMQNSDSGSLVFGSKPSSSQATSPFREIVGCATEQASSSSLCSSPDDNSCDGVKLEETEMWQLREVNCTQLPGAVLSICPYLNRYFLVSAGCILNVYGFHGENPHRLRKFASARTRFTITCLTTLSTRIVVGDCRDGILFYSYQEDLRKLEQLYCDPVQRLVADCALVDLDTAVVSDRRGNISILSRMKHLDDNASPECNLTLSCSYYMGETAMSIHKGLFSYKLPVDDILKSSIAVETIPDVANSIMACTLLGSVTIFMPISREEHELLEAVQARLAVHPLTAPILGNNHNEFRGRRSPAGVPKILDGDMLAQFLELTSVQQEAVLACESQNVGTPISNPSESPSIPTDGVVRLLERVHYALN